MLILLFTLQTPACCDDIVTHQLTLPPAVEQSLYQEQPQAAPVNQLIATPVTALTEAASTKSANTRTVLVNHVNIPNTTIKLASSETSINIQTQMADATELELISLAPTSGYGKPATTINQGIKTDIDTSIATIAGSGFVKIANTGEVLDDDANQWECVEDKHNNLVWEVKKDDNSIRDKDFSYTWLHNINGTRKGTSNGGRCKGGVSCDTSSYVRAINEQKLCNYTDWRLPTRNELETLVEYNNNPREATINNAYFPQAIPSWYWTATENPQREDFAWYVLFKNGIALNDLKERPKHIRLVRGTIQQ